MAITRSSNLTIIPKGYFPKSVAIGNGISGTRFKKEVMRVEKKITEHSPSESENELFSPKLNTEKITHPAHFRQVGEALLEKLNETKGHTEAINLIKKQLANSNYLQGQKTLTLMA